MSHTKGSWTGGNLAINDEQGRLLANVWFEGVQGDIPKSEGHANSRLMAASPDMLNFLEMISGSIAETGTFTMKAGGLADVLLMKILKKARGL